MRPTATIPDAEFDRSVEQAAKLLSASNFPVIAGLDTDLAGVVAAFRLARLLGGAVDHRAAEASLRDQAVLQSVGQMFVSPGEARQRADVFLLVGDRPLQAWPDLPDFLFADGPTHFSDATPRRHIVSLSRRDDVPRRAENSVTWLQADTQAISALLAAIRARVNARPLASGFDLPRIDRLVGQLQSARFGVAIWSPGEIDALTIEMLTGLVKDLNEGTRWSGLSVADDVSVVGASRASAWMTGFPLRTGFGRGAAEHDPWAFDARRLVESGEADAVVWISAFGEPPPDWLAAVPAIIVGDVAPTAGAGQAVRLGVGRPGKDHGGVVHDRRTGALAEIPAAFPRAMPGVADALNRIAGKVAAS